MSQKIRIGLVGAGKNTRERHIPGFQAIPGVEIIGVTNRTLESSQRVASAFGIPKSHERWEDCVNDPEVDAVCIGTWPYMHCPVTLAALEANKHVLCEARMAMNATEARQMLAASQARPDLISQLVPSPYMLGPDAAIYDFLQSNRLGDVLSVDLRFCADQFIDRESPLTWRQDRKRSGLNTLAMGILYETLMRWVGEARRVTANTRVFAAERMDESGKKRSIEVPDHVEILCDLKSRGVARLCFSAVTGLGPKNECWIFGTNGTLRVDFAAQRIFGGVRGDAALVDLTPPESSYQGWRVEEEFISAIRGQEKIKFTTFEDGLKYMEFTEAVATSSITGQAVELPLRQLSQF